MSAVEDTLIPERAYNPASAAATGPDSGAQQTPQSSMNPSTAPGNTQGVLLVSEDTVIVGEVRNCRHLENRGYIEGAVSTENMIIHPEGRFFGTLKAGSADIRGTLQGEAFVRNLIHIGETGSVNGNIQYGKISIATGGDLSAELRNIPPEIAGDMQIAVARGKAVSVSTLDLTAIDPDDDAKSLTYTVSAETHGFIAMSQAPGRKINRFTQADLEGNSVIFVHDGTNQPTASFSVVVSDKAGATSGAPQTVNVAVKV